MRLMFGIAILLVLLHAINFNINVINALNVSYDHRSLLFDGKPRILISGSIHYPRSTPQMWPQLIAMAKEGGLDVVQTYVFWNLHEPQKGNYDFNERLDLVKFVKLVHEAGLYVNLRIGPYITAEWSFGGLPVWLHLEPGVVFRTDNEPFKEAMQAFTAKIVQMMKDEKLFAWQGGPIILAQIENEFGGYPSGTPEKAYAMWAGKMAVGLNTGVPWIMCKQDDAPDPVINTWNGYYADDFQPNSPSKPKMWTENWTGWLQVFGSPTPYRPVQDIAFAVSRFFQKSGSYNNYYMYHGGTNFGRTPSTFISASYDYDAPIDEYGLPNQPKWGHLKDLHRVLKLCEPALIEGPKEYISFSPKQEAFVYSNEVGDCAAFLSNVDESATSIVLFRGQNYTLPPWSVSILPDCKAVAFNSAKVTAQTASITMKPTNALPSGPGSAFEWVKEPVGSWGVNVMMANKCLEQIETTRDLTDYLWYVTRVNISEDEPFFKNGNKPILTIGLIRDHMYLFINGEYTANSIGNQSAQSPIALKAGSNEIAIMSMTLGMLDGGPRYDFVRAGIQGPVTLNGLQHGPLDLSNQQWIHQVGLKGEYLNLYSEQRTKNFTWGSADSTPKHQPLIWYKTYFDAPSGSNPLALDLSSMGKGQAWVNGHHIGRFWPSLTTSQSDACSTQCDYRGYFFSEKCMRNCGKPSQIWYHVPRDWIKKKGNLLVIFEEIGGDPAAISLVARSVDKVYAVVSESHPPPVNNWPFSNGHSLPVVKLHCNKGSQIHKISFASYGWPLGRFGYLQEGSCHSSNSLDVVKKACLGLNSCSIEVSPLAFGGDPCIGQMKKLAVEAHCS